MDQRRGTAASKPVWGNSHLRNYSPDSMINSFQKMKSAHAHVQCISECINNVLKHLISASDLLLTMFVSYHT